MAKIRKSELVEIVAHKAHLTKRASEEAITVFLDEIGRTLSKGLDSRVVLSGFGTFKTIRMKGKTVKAPKGEKMYTVKPHLYPSFTPGKKLKRKVKR